MSDNLDLTDLFAPASKVAEPVHDKQELQRIDDLGVIGEGVLKNKGFYARIVSAEQSEASLMPAQTRLLVVEDDEATLKVIVKVLSHHGYQTLTARNKAEFLKALAGMPHLILLDAMLPDLNGFDVLNRVRQHPRTRHIPIVMLTSLSDRKDIAKGLALGADGYLTKPVLPSTLLDAVQAIIAG